MERKFKIGDMVVGNKLAKKYGITRPGTVWKVLAVSDYTILVGWISNRLKEEEEDRMAERNGYPSEILDKFYVEPESFDLFHGDLSEDTLTKKIKEVYEK